MLSPIQKTQCALYSISTLRFMLGSNCCLFLEIANCSLVTQICPLCVLTIPYMISQSGKWKIFPSYCLQQALLYIWRKPKNEIELGDRTSGPSMQLLLDYEFTWCRILLLETHEKTQAPRALCWIHEFWRLGSVCTCRNQTQGTTYYASLAEFSGMPPAQRLALR